MKALFMTSCIIFYGKPNAPVKNCNNSNGLIDKIRVEVGDIKKLAFVVSNPDNPEWMDSRATITQQSLKLDGFSIDDMVIIDRRFKGNIKETILSSDLVFLCGGHVPTQNKYFKEIGLKEILAEYDGVIVGQSAGSMNCSKMVYAQEEYEEELLDPSYQKEITGLGLCDVAMMPHMNEANKYEVLGETTYTLCLKDSYKIPHYGLYDDSYILVKDGKAEAFGKTVYFQNGKEIPICENGESYVIYEKGKENEKNN